MKGHTLAPPLSLDELLNRFLGMDPEDRTGVFCTVAEAALVAAVGTRTVQRWIEAGKVDAVLVGPRYWLMRESLLRYLRFRANGDS